MLLLIDEAIADPLVNVGVCSTAKKEDFDVVVENVLGKERVSKLNLVLGC